MPSGALGKRTEISSAPAQARLDLQGRRVTLRHGGDDRKPEAEPITMAGPVGAQALERLQQPAYLLGRYHTAGVGDGEGGLVGGGGSINRARARPSPKTVCVAMLIEVASMAVSSRFAQTA